MLSAYERGAGGERQSEEERQSDRAAVEQALECGKLCERHDKVPLVHFDPLGEQGRVRSGRCLDSIDLNDVNMIFTSFGFNFTVRAMRETGNAQIRPYHHGDLSRALVEAARRILEAEGPAALSLRAVAREAGVSPAAPYHHFRDKTELLEAVAEQGWEALGEAIAGARAKSPSPRESLARIGLAYVKFARANPALYRLMYDTTRDRTAMPQHSNEDGDKGFNQVQCAIIEAGGSSDPIDLELATIAAWCAAHGLAEMAGFKDFQPLKDAMGGEDAFLMGVLQHIGVLTHRPKHDA